MRAENFSDSESDLTNTSVEKTGETSQPLRVPELNSIPNRRVSAAAERLVHERNGAKGCEFVNAATGNRCGSHFQLQRDHIEPWSHGGTNEADNLRLLCANHNRWRWTKRPTA